MLNLPHSPATVRNREPIFSVLHKRMQQATKILEIASGTGEHAAWMAPQLPNVNWVPSDKSSSSLSIIDAYNHNNNNVSPAILLDVEQEWPSDKYDGILCINMIHIAAWRSCQALLEHAPKHLSPNGFLYLYGPYKKQGKHTAPSNESFDQWLKSQHADWGVRNVEDVVAEAQNNQLRLRRCVSMPANNLSLIFTC